MGMRMKNRGRKNLGRLLLLLLLLLMSSFEEEQRSLGFERVYLGRRECLGYVGEELESIEGVFDGRK